MFLHRSGFTLVELVTVLLVVAILAAVVGPKLADGFAQPRAFYDRTSGMIRLARATAIAQRRPVFVRIDGTAGSVTVCYSAAGACTSPPVPPGQDGWSINTTSGVTIAPTATLQFDALGRYLDAAGADPGASLAIVVSTYTITVERETGYVR